MNTILLIISVAVMLPASLILLMFPNLYRRYVLRINKNRGAYGIFVSRYVNSNLHRIQVVLAGLVFFMVSILLIAHTIKINR